eukprot:m.261899 g.261899  ORF g.261899 m.261899 type:complete len:128 (-) comp54616_c0_seq48:346-729(-)
MSEQEDDVSALFCAVEGNELAVCQEIVSQCGKDVITTPNARSHASSSSFFSLFGFQVRFGFPCRFANAVQGDSTPRKRTTRSIGDPAVFPAAASQLQRPRQVWQQSTDSRSVLGVHGVRTAFAHAWC